MTDEKLPIGTKFKCHFGNFDLPSPILQVGIFDDYLEFECEDGYYRVTKEYVPNEKLLITKVR